jgi:hypothetical protein
MLWSLSTRVAAGVPPTVEPASSLAGRRTSGAVSCACPELLFRRQDAAPPVAQTCSLLYRRFLTCHLPPAACCLLPASHVLPITNRRYGRLKICATLKGYLPGWLPIQRRMLSSVVETSRCDVRAACSGATPSSACAVRRRSVRACCASERSATFTSLPRRIPTRESGLRESNIPGNCVSEAA